MTPRDLIISLGTAAILGSAGFLILSGNDAPALAATRDDSQGNRASKPKPPDPVVMVRAEGPVNTVQGAIKAEETSREVDTSGWTHGRVAGDISMDPRVIGDLGAITVEIREARRGGESKPHRQVKSVEWAPGMGTPSFTFENIPFSSMGYCVAVFGQGGINGSQRFLEINEDKPLHNIELSLSPAVPFTVILRDQFAAPVRDTRVEAWPVDAPLGRPVLSGTTDNFGTATFPKTLAGHYQVFVGSKGLQLVEPVEVDVMPAGFVLNRSAQVNHQSLDIEVPQGELVDVRVTCYGQPVAGARLQVYQTEAREFREYVGETDAQGKCEMPPLPAGRYHVAVEHARYQRYAEEVVLEAVNIGQPRREIQVHLRN